jgi:hypothetical protein
MKISTEAGEGKTTKLSRHGRDAELGGIEVFCCYKANAM